MRSKVFTVIVVIVVPRVHNLTISTLAAIEMSIDAWNVLANLPKVLALRREHPTSFENFSITARAVHDQAIILFVVVASVVVSKIIITVEGDFLIGSAIPEDYEKNDSAVEGVVYFHITMLVLAELLVQDNLF